MSPAPSKGSLAERIAAEFAAHANAQKASEEQRARWEQEREQRLRKFSEVCDSLRDVWGPRLEEFASQFGEKISVTPSVEPSRRQATVVFKTSLASIRLTLSASANNDVTAIVLDYDLLILPMMFKYERHSTFETPLDAVDREAVARWIDDRLISAVRAYLEVQENDFYISRAMVEDPMTGERFLRDDAAGSIVQGGRTRYFASEESLLRFKEQHGIA